MLPHLHCLSQNLHYDFVLINQERFQGNVPFYQVFKEFSYSSNGWVSSLWLSKSLTQNQSGLLIDNRTCLPGQEAEDISPSPGEGHGSPFRCSCLETPVDREPGRLQSTGLRRVRHN